MIILGDTTFGSVVFKMLKNSNRYLACHPRLWLRDERSAKDLSEPGVFPSTETAVSAARYIW